MGDLFNINIEALRKISPRLALAIEGAEPQPLEVEDSKSGEKTFKYGGIYFHSRYDPVKEATEQTDKLLEKRRDRVILFGMGFGFFPRALLDKGVKSVVVFEPSLQILKAAFSSVDLVDILSSGSFSILNDLGELASLLKKEGDAFDDFVTFQSPPYMKTYPAELKDFLDTVSNIQSTLKVVNMTSVQSKADWYRNFFDNVPRLLTLPLIESLKDGLKGVPMVIVGAGPSLEKNAHLLKALKGRAIIIAAVSAYRPLLKLGVHPDFVITIEKDDLSRFFSDTEEDRDVRLMLSDVAHPGNFTAKEAKNIFAFFVPYTRISIDSAGFFGSSYFPASGGSVSTIALDMGFKFGCDPIVFVGQDLAYGEGKSHASGSAQDVEELVIDEKEGVRLKTVHTEEGVSNEHHFDLFWLKGQGGEKVPSRYDWVGFHQWIEEAIRGFKEEGGAARLLNSTEGGAYIEGMEHIPLSEAIESFLPLEPSIDVEEIISDAENSRIERDVEGLISFFAQIVRDTKSVQSLALEILKKVERILKALKKGGLTPGSVKDLDTLERIEKKLYKQSESVSFIWDIMTAEQHVVKGYLREEGKGSEDEKFREDLNALKFSYSQVVKTCREYMPLINETIKCLKDRSDD